MTEKLNIENVYNGTLNRIKYNLHAHSLTVTQETKNKTKTKNIEMK